MSKPNNPARIAENEAKAVARMLRVSPQKLNLLAQLIRGKKVERALADLQFSRKRWKAPSPTPRTIMDSMSTTWSSRRLLSARRS